MKITRDMKNFVNRAMGYNKDWLDDAGYAFYYRCLAREHMSLLDADEYAHLNTLIGYDIGIDAAMKISSFLWEKDIEVLELNSGDEDREEVRKAVEALGLDIRLDKWLEGPMDGYTYYN